MWDLNDINQKKKYVIERLKNCHDEKERERLELTLVTYVNLLEHNGTIRYTGFYNLMDLLSNNKFTLVKNFEYDNIMNSIIKKNQDYLDDDYLRFLIDILKRISNNSEILNYEIKQYVPFKLTEEELVALSLDFYTKLGDNELENYAKQILNDKSILNFTTRVRKGSENIFGITCGDYIFQKPYLTVRKSGKIVDLVFLIHEVMHGIDFKFTDKIFSESYYGFHEISTYTIERLWCDYMKESKTMTLEIEKFRKQIDRKFVSLAVFNYYQIKQKSFEKFGVNGLNLGKITNIKEIINRGTLKNLLEVESAVIAYGLYKQIKEDKEKGLLNLKKFMKTKLPKDRRPDFSFIGLDDSRILKLAEEIGKSQIIKNNNLKK